MRSIEYPKDGACYSSEKEEGDEQENGPETAGTAATSAVTTAAWMGLGTVGWACGAVQLGFGGGEGGIVCPGCAIQCLSGGGFG